jgi:hypothetical protein
MDSHAFNLIEDYDANNSESDETDDDPDNNIVNDEDDITIIDNYDSFLH